MSDPAIDGPFGGTPPELEEDAQKLRSRGRDVEKAMDVPLSRPNQTIGNVVRHDSAPTLPPDERAGVGGKPGTPRLRLVGGTGLFDRINRRLDVSRMGAEAGIAAVPPELVDAAERMVDDALRRIDEEPIELPPLRIVVADEEELDIPDGLAG